MITGIAHELKRQALIGRLDNRSSSEALFQRIKRVLETLRPFKRGVFHQNTTQGCKANDLGSYQVLPINLSKANTIASSSFSVVE